MGSRKPELERKSPDTRDSMGLMQRREGKEGVPRGGPSLSHPLKEPEELNDQAASGHHHISWKPC